MNNILNLEPFNSKLFLNGVILTCVIGFFAITSSPPITFITKTEIREWQRSYTPGRNIDSVVIGRTVTGPSEPFDSIVIGEKAPGDRGVGIKPKAKSHSQFGKRSPVTTRRQRRNAKQQQGYKK